jgi:hypothetical protein
MRGPIAALACLACAGVVGVACSSHKQEAASLVAAIDRFHKADNPEKPDRAKALARVACTDPEVCEAKRLCEVATTATADALILKAEVELRLADLERGALAKTDDIARALPGKLDQAEQRLSEGHAAMPACDQKILALRARYDL